MLSLRFFGNLEERARLNIMRVAQKSSEDLSDAKSRDMPFSRDVGAI